MTMPEEWLRKLMNAHAVQGRDGNWNYSPYMRGMFNGLELALSIVQNEREPRYKDAPPNYLSDDRNKAYPDYLSTKRADNQLAQAVTVYGIGINEWDRYQRMVEEMWKVVRATFAPVVHVNVDDQPPTSVDLVEMVKEVSKRPQSIHVIPRNPMDPALVAEGLIGWLKGCRDVWDEGTLQHAILDRLVDDACDNAATGQFPWHACPGDGCSGCVACRSDDTAVIPRITDDSPSPKGVEGIDFYDDGPTRPMPIVKPRPIRNNPQA